MTSVEWGHEDKSLTRSTPLPLCVDLDGTLLRSDLLIESALSLVARNPTNVFRMIGWLFRGKAHLKAEIAKRAVIDTATLPYNKAVIDWLRPQAGTREIILCTASDQLLAHKVADHVACFSGVLASDGSHNLAGARKAAALVLRFGEKGFDYVGNAPVDLDVWKHACHAIVVEHGNRLSRAAGKVSTVEKVFHYDRPSLKTWLKAIRIHQWIKNILIFLPLLVSHRLFDARAVTDSALAFLCFGLCASSVYLTNDLLDLEADRQHERKRHRPFAAGSIPVVFGPVAAVVLLVAAFVIAWEVHHVFLGVLASYYVLTTGYSLRFKRMMMLDVVVLAMLYTTRILAGTAAIHSKPSFWLLAFSMFIFLSLAMVKRYTELLALQCAGKVTANGRGYDVEDIPLVQSLGGSSGYMAVLVLALYIDSAASEILYRHPHHLWLLCPLLLYWISRTWAIAHRGVMHDDPIVFAVTDNVSRIILGIAAAIVVASV
jgi:4-hydroxybenzoate polyprenyltransferase